MGLTLYYLFFLFMYLHICGCIFFQQQFLSYTNSVDKIYYYEQLNILEYPDKNASNLNFELKIFKDEKE